MFFCFFQVKPYIKKNASENLMITLASESVFLYCSIGRSSPPPTLSWWYQTCPKDATACKPSLQGWGRMATDNTSSLVLEQLSIPPSQDHVIYKCIAENWLGHDDVTYTILRRLGRYKENRHGTFIISVQLVDNPFYLERRIIST